jgi:hypothetical protein
VGHFRQIHALPHGVKLRWLRLKQAATYGGVGEERARELVQTGKWIAYRDGRRIIVDVQSIDAHNESLPEA